MGDFERALVERLHLRFIVTVVVSAALGALFSWSILSGAIRDAKEAAISESDKLLSIRAGGLQGSIMDFAKDLYDLRERIEKLEVRCR